MFMRTAVVLACLALFSACPIPDDPQNDDEATDSTDSTDTTDGTDTTEDTDSTDTTDDTGDGDSNHGMVKIEIAAEDPRNPPFAGTTHVTATVQYNDCLTDFYLLTNPDLQQSGVAGAAVFGEFVDRLCDPTLENVVACEVLDIDQTLLEDVNVYSLRVRFAITDADAIQDRWLYVGPLPTTDLVGDSCGGSLPRAEIRANGLFGGAAADAQDWVIKTLPAANEATTDQATPLLVTVGN
jgi:hypothetical protein